MKILRYDDRPYPRARMEGALSETVLVEMSAGPSNPVSCGCDTDTRPRGTVAVAPADRWELVLVEARAGAAVLPIPFPTYEAGFILSGRVELAQLPQDYDVTVPVAEQGAVAVLGPGDAFGIERGERVMIDVLTDLTFLVWRRVVQRDAEGAPGGLCV